MKYDLLCYKLFFGFSLFGLIVDKSSGADAKSIAFSGRTICETLPFQAVRIQCTLSNRSDTDSLRILPLEDHINLKGIVVPGEGPSRTRFRVSQPYSGLYPNRIPGTRAAPSEEFRSDIPKIRYVTRYQPVELRPGQSESMIFPFTPHSPHVKDHDWFFSTPGTYHCWVLYEDEGIFNNEFASVHIKIDVRELTTDSDRAVFGILTKHRDLAEVILARYISHERLPSDEIINELGRIVLRHPQSSYADYARHALALIYLGGSDKIDEAKPDAKVPALALLRAIDHDTFAYAPDALLLQRRLTEDADARKAIEARLEKDFYDAEEWLRAKAEEMPIEELRRLRDNAPVPRKPRGSRD